MSKTNKELAVELVIAQIQAHSVIKKDQLHTGSIIKSDDIDKLLKRYYNMLESLDSDKTE